MELKDGAVRLIEAAEYLSQATGRLFTADNLLEADDALPICALIPRSLASPKFSGRVQRAVVMKIVEVEMDAEAARKGHLTQGEIVEAAKRRLTEDIAIRLETEKVIHEEGIYLLSRRDLNLMRRHGVQTLIRGVPFLSLVAKRCSDPALAEAVEFGKPVDVQPGMLCVLKGYLVKYAELVAAQQLESSAPIPPAPAVEQAASVPMQSSELSHKDEIPAKLTPEPERWILRAREHANSIWLSRLANNKRPAKEEIANEISSRLHRDDKMVTRLNKRITSKYVLRFALSPTANGGWSPPDPE